MNIFSKFFDGITYYMTSSPVVPNSSPLEQAKQLDGKQQLDVNQTIQVPAGDQLHARHLLYVCAPRADQKIEGLEKCYANIFQKALKEGHKTILLPCFSVDLKGGFTPQDAAYTAVKCLVDFLKQNPNTQMNIKFVVHDNDDAKSHLKAYLIALTENSEIFVEFPNNVIELIKGNITQMECDLLIIPVSKNFNGGRICQLIEKLSFEPKAKAEFSHVNFTTKNLSSLISNSLQLPTSETPFPVPKDLNIHIFSFLPTSDLVSARLISRFFLKNINEILIHRYSQPIDINAVEALYDATKELPCFLDAASEVPSFLIEQKALRFAQSYEAQALKEKPTVGNSRFGKRNYIAHMHQARKEYVTAAKLGNELALKWLKTQQQEPDYDPKSTAGIHVRIGLNEFSNGINRNKENEEAIKKDLMYLFESSPGNVLEMLGNKHDEWEIYLDMKQVNNIIENESNKIKVEPNFMNHNFVINNNDWVTNFSDAKVVPNFLLSQHRKIISNIIQKLDFTLAWKLGRYEYQNDSGFKIAIRKFITTKIDQFAGEKVCGNFLSAGATPHTWVIYVSKDLSSNKTLSSFFTSKKDIIMDYGIRNGLYFTAENWDEFKRLLKD